MHIEFIDLLRCPRPHEDSWLIAAFDRMDGRLVVDGKLGCPVCNAEYPISGGVADFRAKVGEPYPIRSAASVRAATPAPETERDDDVMRLAAMLGLSRPGMLVLLAGREARLSHRLATLTSVRVLSVNPNAADIGDSDAVGSIMIDSAVPIASRSVDGIALDAAAASLDLVEEAVRVLTPGGRLTAPASVLLPGSLRELARDHLNVVAESVGELVALGR